MKLVLNAKDFIEVASIITKAVSVKDTQAQTLIKINKIKNKMILKYRSATAFFKGSINVDSIEGMEEDTLTWGVDGAQLKVILSVLSKEEPQITLETSADGRIFVIKSATSTLKLPIYENPTILNEEKPELIGRVNAIEFLDTVMSLLKLSVANEMLQEHPISCLHLFLENSTLAAMSTNTIALIEKKIPVADLTKKTIVLLKPAQASLLHAKFDSADVIDLYQTPTMFGYIDSKKNIISLVQKAEIKELEYSGFKNMVSNDQIVSLDLLEFKNKIDNAAKLCPACNELTLEFDKNNLSIKNLNLDKFDMTVESNLQPTKLVVEKPTFSIICNILSDKIKMSWGNENQSLIQLHCLDNDGNNDDNVFAIITTNEQR